MPHDGWNGQGREDPPFVPPRTSGEAAAAAAAAAAASSLPMLQPLPTSHPPRPRQPPPGLDLPESFVGDRTCHGMLGSTLRQALEELLVMMQQESVPQLLSPAVAVPGVSRRRRQSRGGADDPVDRDNDDSADSQSEDLEHDDSEDPKDGDESQAPGAARLAPGMVEPILNSLGEAMAKTHRDRLANHSNNDENARVRLVSGLIRGRVRHWNRRGAKWRIVADAGTEIRPIRPSQRRRVLHRNRQGQQQAGRRRAERGSLWQAAAAGSDGSQESGQSQERAMKLSSPLEILAYNDKE
jgi:hypothetical protein